MRLPHETALQKQSESIVPRSGCNLKFQVPALVAGALVFLLAAVAFLPQAGARNLAGDPNLAQRVQQFTYKPAPGELLLKPKAKHKKPAKDADD
jgi:hypothetical protein